MTEKDLDRIKRRVYNFFDINRNAISPQEINRDMHDNVNINIDNVLILGSAIIIASIGLNLDSVAVIIGAMLISPIMSPLFTVAYCLVTRDGRLLNKSLRRVFIYIFVAIFISTIYFKISFIKSPTPSIISRTNPTVFDLAIAVFGGVAGIIGITRKEKTNVIPGVAIATALMPPLCTVGYGIANWNPDYIFNALILFITNAYFIVLTAAAVLFFMKLRAVDNIQVEAAEKIRRVTTFILVLILFGTLYNTFISISKANVETGLEEYITESINSKDIVIEDTNVDYSNEEIIFKAKDEISKEKRDDLKQYISKQRYISNFDSKIIYEDSTEL